MIACTSAWRRALESAQRLLAQRNIKFLFVIVPSKDTIYPEFLPASEPRARSISRLDEMLAVLARSKVEYLELRTPLLEARKRHQLYDHVDSHWNGHGARIGAESILKRTAQLLGRSDGFAELDSHLSPRKSWADLPLILSLEGLVDVPSVELLPNRTRARRLLPPESVLAPTRKQWSRVLFELDEPALPKAIVIRDSFSDNYMPTLNEHFRRTLYLWTHEIDLRDVDKEQPDIVIMEMTERFLSDAPPKLQPPRKR